MRPTLWQRLVDWYNSPLHAGFMWWVIAFMVGLFIVGVILDAAL